MIVVSEFLFLVNDPHFGVVGRGGSLPTCMSSPRSHPGDGCYLHAYGVCKVTPMDVGSEMGWIVVYHGLSHIAREQTFLVGL